MPATPSNAWALASALLVQLFLWPHMTFWVGLVSPEPHTYELTAACFGLAGAYLLDRTKGADEDASSDFSVALAGRYYARALRAVFVLSCIIVGACGLEHAHVWGVAVRAVLAFYFYTARMPLLGWRFKDLFPGSKALFVASLQTWWPFAMAGVWEEALATRADLVACLFVSFVLATCFMDVKDIEGDRRAGVVTVANVLGHRRCVAYLAAGYGGLACYALTAGTAPLALGATYLITAANMAHCAETGRVPKSWSIWSMMALPRVLDLIVRQF